MAECINGCVHFKLVDDESRDQQLLLYKYKLVAATLSSKDVHHKTGLVSKAISPEARALLQDWEMVGVLVPVWLQQSSCCPPNYSSYTSSSSILTYVAVSIMWKHSDQYHEHKYKDDLFEVCWHTISDWQMPASCLFCAVILLVLSTAVAVRCAGTNDLGDSVPAGVHCGARQCTLHGKRGAVWRKAKGCLL